MNFNFDAHLIESRMRTQAADRRATLAASHAEALATLPKRSWFAWLRRGPISNQPVSLPQRPGETASSCSAKAA